MSYIERGLYRELLDECWIEGFIPKDIDQLADICGCPPDVMANAWQTLSNCFVLQDDLLINEKIESIRTHQDAIRVQRKIAGRNGGLAKAMNALSNAKQNLANASNCHIEEKSREEKRREKNKTSSRQAAVLCPVGVSDQVWKDFVATRGKSAVTETALKGIAREAQKAGWSLEAALQECAIRGWRGFKAEWVNKTSNGYMINKQEALEARNRAVGDAWLKKMEIEENANI